MSFDSVVIPTFSSSSKEYKELYKTFVLKFFELIRILREYKKNRKYLRIMKSCNGISILIEVRERKISLKFNKNKFSRDDLRIAYSLLLYILNSLSSSLSSSR